MIRAVAITSLVTLLMLVLYLPSSQPPEHYRAQLRLEHHLNNECWGSSIAERVLNRMLALQDQAQTHSPVPAPTSAPDTRQVPSAVGQEMARVNARLFDNSYFRSIDALLALAAYRLATLLEWIAPSWVVAMTLFLDALLERSLKAKELRHHHPEMFALYASLTILVVSGCTLALVWPWRLPPLLWAALPSTIALLAARSVCHVPKRP